MVMLELRKFYQVITLHLQHNLNHVKLFRGTSWTDIMSSKPIETFLLQGGME